MYIYSRPKLQSLYPDSLAISNNQMAIDIYKNLSQRLLHLFKLIVT